MQPIYFVNLPPQQQLDMLYYKGNLLANRYGDRDIFLLYSLNDFFVELRYDGFTNELLQATAFRASDERLEQYLPYLSPIDLE
nr:hypothetical protein [uncultured Arsenicibacter sp.]